MSRRLGRDPRDLADADSAGLAALFDSAVPLIGTASGRPRSGSGEAAGTVRIPGYRILAELGRGAQGVVYRAVQEWSGREAAVKVLRDGPLAGERDRARFRREVELAARLDHPGIARVYDGGVADGRCYCAMELIDGLRLDQYAAEQLPDRRQVLMLMAEACRAVQHAHQRGVIHRDLKPSNILVDADGRPHVVDFGLARSLLDTCGPGDHATRTAEGHCAGTPAFMSPEQAAGRADRIDIRSDVYSLGATLYLLLVGRPPCDTSGAPHEVLKRVAEARVRRPRQLRPDLDGELEAVLLKSLAADPERRYASAGELAADLDNYLRGRPLSARPVTAAYFLRKWVKRHRLPLTVAAAVAGLLLAAAAYSHVRIQHERDAAVEARGRAEAERARAEENARLALAEKARADRERDVAAGRLADSLIAQGQAMAAAGEWVEAKALYADARDRLTALGRSPLPAEFGLVSAYAVSPPPLNRLVGHRGPASAGGFSPDGRLAVSGGRDGTLRLWDVVTGRLVRTFTGHAAEVTAAAVAPDGRLLSGSKDHTARLWDPRDGRTLHRMEHSGEVTAVAFSRDGRLCAVAEGGGVVRVWDVDTGRQVGGFDRHRGWALDVAFMADGRTCLSAGSDGVVRQWDVASGQQVRQFGLGGTVHSIAVSPDGRRLLAGGGIPWNDPYGLLGLWDLADGRLVRRLRGQRDAIGRVGFSADGRLAMSAAGDGTVAVWDLEHAERDAPVRTITGDGSGLEHVAFSPDGRAALSGGPDGVLKLWDLRGDGGVPVLQSSLHGVKAVSPSADGRLVLVGEDAVRLWDVATGKSLFSSARFYAVYDAALSPDGRWAAAALDAEVGEPGRVLLWDLAGGGGLGSDRAVCREVCRGEGVESVAFSPDGGLLASAGGDMVRIFRLPDLVECRRFRSDRVLMKGVATATRPGGGRLLLASTERGAARLYEMDAGLYTPDLWGWREAGRVNGRPAFTPDLRLALAGSGPDLLAWEPLTGRRLHTFTGHKGRVDAAAVSPDGRWAASGCSDGTVKLWDLARLREVHTFAGHAAAVTSVAFSADGRLLVSGGEDNAVRVWDLSRPATYRQWAPRLETVRAKLAQREAGDASGTRDAPGAAPGLADSQASADLGEWYAYRGVWDRAAELLERARAGGADVSSLTLARCYWTLGRGKDAGREFRNALARHQAPEPYLNLCIRAVTVTPTTRP